MPIDDFSTDKPDGSPNAATTPGKYIKLVVPDFSDTVANTNPTTMAPTPLSSYLRLGAVEDVTKAGKPSGTVVVGLITDLAGNPLSVDPNAPFNPSYDPYAPFGDNNFPSDGKTALPPATTPTSQLAPYTNVPIVSPGGFIPAPKATTFPVASGPDPTGEDLASLVQGFADDTRNRGKPRMVLPPKDAPHKRHEKAVHTPGGQPNDAGTTAQGPLYGYPWVAPVMGLKAPGQMDAVDPNTHNDGASSKPLFFPDDYRTLESSQLHTKGGWRDHTDGNRITTTRGNKVEVIRGNYKLIVLGRQDQTKPRYGGMDISGGQAVTVSNSGTSDLAADASADYNQGSTAYSSLFEWRQCTTQQLFNDAVKAAAAAPDPTALQEAMEADQATYATAKANVSKATKAALAAVDPQGVLASTIAAAQVLVQAATTTVQEAFAATALATATKALTTAEQAYDPRLLQGPALVATAALAPPGWTAADVTNATTAARAAASAAWGTQTVASAVQLAKNADTTAQTTPGWANAYAALAAWLGVAADQTVGNQYTVDAGNKTAAAAAVTAASAAVTAATAEVATAQTAATNAQTALNASPNDPKLLAALAAANAALTTAQATLAAATADAANAKSESTAAAATAAADVVPTAALPAAAKTALQAWTGTINGVATPPANALSAAALVAELAQTPPGLDLTDLAAQALQTAEYSMALYEAAMIEAGLSMSPLETLQLWEDAPLTASAPPPATDYRSFATTKKGSGPKVQVKYQGDPKGVYAQSPGDGVTYATPVSMGVSINETWSYQIYNYTGMGYYPATAPQPWPPPWPKTQFQSVSGTASPVAAQTPTRPEIDDWSPVPQWVIYPVAKIVNKSHVVHQSTELFARRTVAITAGLRTDSSIPDPTRPQQTYPTDVPWWVDFGGQQHQVNTDSTASATYDRNLLTDVEFPDDATLAAWIMDTTTTGNTLNLGSYNMVEQIWTETHVANQAAIVRATTTLSDTMVGDQYTKLIAGSTTLNTAVKGLQSVTLHTGNTTVHTTVDGTQSTTVSTGATTNAITVKGLQSTTLTAGSTWNYTTVIGSATSTSFAYDQTNTTHATHLNTNKHSQRSMDLTTALMALSLKAAIVDLQMSVGVHLGMKIGFSLDIVAGPHYTLKLDAFDISAAGKKALAVYHLVM